MSMVTRFVEGVSVRRSPRDYNSTVSTAVQVALLMFHGSNSAAWFTGWSAMQPTTWPRYGAGVAAISIFPADHRLVVTSRQTIGWTCHAVPLRAG